MAIENCEKIISGDFSDGIANVLAGCPVANAFTGGVIGALVVFGIILALILIIALYVYTSLAWYTIGKKLKYRRSWIAWIPIVRLAMILQLGSFHWAWIFLVLIPLLGWLALFVLIIIAKWRIFEKRKYPGWFSLSIILPKIGAILNLIVIGLVAWKDRKKNLF